MGAMSVVAAVITAALLGVGLWVMLRRAVRSSRATPLLELKSTSAERQDVGVMYRSEARASLTAFLVGGAVAAFVWWVGSWWSQGYGLAYAIAGGVGAVAGLTAYNLCPRAAWSSPRGKRVIAELTPRRPTSFARQWVFTLPLASAIALIGMLIITGVYSSTDENGLHRIYQRRGLSGWGVEDGQVVDVQYNLGSTGPFPGWYYGVPIMISAILLIVVVYWSLRRIAAAARPVVPDLFDTDTALRSLRTVFVMTASSAALAFQVAGLLAITGNVLASSYVDPIPTADLMAVPATVPVEPGHTLALIAIFSALIIAVTAIFLLAKALAVITGLWSAGKTAHHSPAAPAQ